MNHATAARSRLRTLAVAGVATFGLAACGSTAKQGAGATVHPFDEIRAGAVTFEGDTSDPSASCST